MKRKVYFYKDTEIDEIITLCHYCAQEYGDTVKEIDKAGEWDMCSNCDAQNVPQSYLSKYDEYGDIK